MDKEKMIQKLETKMRDKEGQLRDLLPFSENIEFRKTEIKRFEKLEDEVRELWHQISQIRVGKKSG